MNANAEWVDVDQLLSPTSLRPSFQPIFDLATGEMVAVEALARWPDLGVTPDVAFQSARKFGRLAELDAACRAAAITAVIAHGSARDFHLFVNVEPSVLELDTADQLIELAQGRVNLVVEITERALTTRPAELLWATRNLSAAGIAIALDDVGVQPDSLALLPFISPSVIKLDLSLVQGWPDARQSAVLAAVAAYTERFGTTVLAEGIENEWHLEQAVAIGATLGQGWHFAHPGPLGDTSSIGKWAPNILGNDHALPPSPFACVSKEGIRIAKKGMLMGISEHFESQGFSLATPPIVMSTFQDAQRFTPATAQRYERLAARCPLVAAFGSGLDAEPAPGVRGVTLREDDPLCGEWVVAVVGPHYCGALIARDLGDEGPDLNRRFAYTISHDRDVVLEVSRSLISRIGRS